MIIQAEPLKRLVTTILKKGGSKDSEAQVVADHLVRSNLAGHDSHGVGMLPIYLRMLQADLLKPNQDPELFKSDGSIMMFDGKRGYGQAVGKIAMEKAIESVEILSNSFDTYLLSTAPWDNPTAWSDKVIWVKKYLGEVAFKRLILSHHKNLNKGDYLNSKNLTTKRPGIYISAKNWEKVIGKRARRNIKTDTPIHHDDF